MLAFCKVCVLKSNYTRTKCDSTRQLLAPPNRYFTHFMLAFNIFECTHPLYTNISLWNGWQNHLYSFLYNQNITYCHVTLIHQRWRHSSLWRVHTGEKKNKSNERHFRVSFGICTVNLFSLLKVQIILNVMCQRLLFVSASIHRYRRQRERERMKGDPKNQI